ncbi:TOMM precursor leader peptide-binding protein [Streptomyces sp. NPDC017529]|uniref:TOMM precursor leader peptide-binding protein n=1 Tax=Streptomyces sp. NPDC017529 TaxID=3365000 RepID=UPI0037A98CC1
MPDRPTGLAVRGEGLLAHAVRTELSRRQLLAGENGGRCAGVLSVDDGWRDTVTAGNPALPWLPVRVELGNVVIGPLVLPGQPGCAQCARTRRDRALGPASPRAELLRRHGDRLAARPSPLLSAWTRDTVAAVVAAEAAAVLDDPEHAGTRNAVTMIGLAALTADRHPFLPDPCCSRCGRLPDDRPPVLMDTPRPKLAPDVYRVRSLDTDWDGLLRTYVDGHTGIVRQLDVRTDYAYPMVSAPLRLPDGIQEAGFGRGLDYGGCERTALAEALERLGGARPGGRRTTVRAGYREVADRAVCPTDLGLYPPDRYEDPEFPYPVFTPDLEINWVWGHSFGRGEPVLVPEDYAYYRTRHGSSSARPLAYEVSNGCALGGCLEEAALHGILELAERDAFLLTWYARLPVPRVDLSTVSDPAVRLLAERIRQESGHRVAAFATTPEHGIATSWVMAVHPGGGPEPAAICAAGAHFDPEQALLNGLLELTANLGWNRAAYREELRRIAGMVADPYTVREMRDHALLYCHPDAYDRFAFLPGEDAEQPVAEAFARATCRPRGDDLREDLAEVVERFTSRGLDVIVVDQSTDEHRAAGFACAKVIIPGLLPMTFGHRMRRTHGLPRLRDVPVRLGYRDRPLEPADVNPHPHPFP